MIKHVKSPADKAKKPSSPEPAKLVDERCAILVETDPETNKVWNDEAEKHMDAFRTGKTETDDAHSVVSELRRCQPSSPAGKPAT